MTYEVAGTQFYQGVASGGGEQDFDYGGKVDQFVILDSGKLGLWQGMTMNMHAETRFGEDVNLDAVGFAPVNVAMLYPKSNEDSTAITGLLFTQALDQNTLVTFGKINALDLFYELYPQTGRGINGFMNASMVIPLAVARVFPLSFMGAGASLIDDQKRPYASVLVYDTHNVPTTSGFEDLGDNGCNIMGYYRYYYDVNGLPGSHFFAGSWSTGDFTSFDPEGFVFIPGQGLVAPRVGGAFALFYIYEQTLWADSCNKKRNVGLLEPVGTHRSGNEPRALVRKRGTARHRHESLSARRRGRRRLLPHRDQPRFREPAVAGDQSARRGRRRTVLQRGDREDVSLDDRLPSESNRPTNRTTRQLSSACVAKWHCKPAGASIFGRI